MESKEPNYRTTRSRSSPARARKAARTTSRAPKPSRAEHIPVRLRPRVHQRLLLLAYNLLVFSVPGNTPPMSDLVSKSRLISHGSRLYSASVQCSRLCAVAIIMVQYFSPPTSLLLCKGEGVKFAVRSTRSLAYFTSPHAVVASPASC